MGVNPLKCLAGLGFLDRTNSCFIGVIQRSFVFVISLDGKKSRLKMINNPFAEKGIIACQCCGSGEYLFNEDGNRNGYCGNCGARIDWPEVELDDWNIPAVNLPKLCSTVMAKYGEREVKVWYSKYGNWMPDGVMTYLKSPDYWRYLTENEHEESNT